MLENPQHLRVASLLDLDVELAETIPDAERPEARRRAAVRVLELERPQWDPAEFLGGAGKDWLGLLVTEGLLLRQVSVRARTACELIGPGDVVRPWDSDGDYDPLAVTVQWLVLAPAQLAVLDARLVPRLARWPAVCVELVRRVSARARHLSLTAAVTHLPRVDARLLLMFWLLADRWGVMTPDGVLVKLPLSHSMLAMLVGAHRPSVTLGLQKLARNELVYRRSSSRWLLTRRAIELLQDPENLTVIEARSTA